MEKTSQYLLAIVGIVMIVGIVTIITNNQYQSYSEEDLTGQTYTGAARHYDPPCDWYRCSVLMQQRCAEDTTGAESFTAECCGRTWIQEC